MVKMKDSGIEWIGEIPETWEVVKIKYYLSRNDIKNHPDEEVLSVYRDYGVVPKNSRTDNHNVTSTDTTNYKYVTEGNLVINKMKAWQGSLAVSNYTGIVSPAYYVYQFKNSKLNKRYFHYLIRNCYKSEFKRLSTGIRDGQWDLQAYDFENTSITLPPKSEQQQIADFLDHKTVEIDGLIDKINTEIDTLKQYQRRLITRAVTKGLDSNVPMKDSGIEWIGEIPETWETIKVKYIVSKLERGTAPKYTELHETQVVNQATFSKGFFDKSNMRYSTIPASQSRGLLQYQDVLVASTGGGVLGKVHYFTEHEEFVADSHVTIVRFIEQKLIPKFGYYYLSTLYDVFNNVMAQGSTNQIELKRDTFANSFIPFPRIEEQRVIVDYLEQKVSQIQTIIKSKQQQMDQLTEYKNSLIFEYVTGKKQVKEAN